MIRPGEPWGSPETAAPDLEVAGGDAALARAVAGAPGALVRFRPDATSDLWRSVGLAPGGAVEPVGTALPVDALLIDERGAIDSGEPAAGTGLVCNMCVLGTPPGRLRWSTRMHEVEVRLDGDVWFHGRATTVVIANGQFLQGLDLVPRGHPGDGRAEVQAYDLARRERRTMRARLAAGAHLPHPRIHQRTARRIEVSAATPLACEADGVTRPERTHLTADVVPGAFRLLV